VLVLEIAAAAAQASGALVITNEFDCIVVVQRGLEL
jgi:hypothetical protein